MKILRFSKLCKLADHVEFRLFKEIEVTEDQLREPYFTELCKQVKKMGLDYVIVEQEEKVLERRVAGD